MVAVVAKGEARVTRHTAHLLNDRQEAVVAADHLTSLQTKMAIYQGGNSDPEVMDWDRNMVVMENLEWHNFNAIKDQIEAKLNSIVPEDWIKYRNGAYQDGKGYPEAMICWEIYFNYSFTMADYRVMLGLVSPHHNMKIGMEILLCKKIMVKSQSLNNQALMYCESQYVNARFTR